MAFKGQPHIRRLSIDSRLNSGQPIKSPTEDSLPPKITKRLVKHGYTYHSKRGKWMPPKPSKGTLPSGVTSNPDRPV